MQTKTGRLTRSNVGKKETDQEGEKSGREIPKKSDTGGTFTKRTITARAFIKIRRLREGKDLEKKSKKDQSKGFLNLFLWEWANGKASIRKN